MAAFRLSTDTPAAETEDKILEDVRPYFTAVAKMQWTNITDGS